MSVKYRKVVSNSKLESANGKIYGRAVIMDNVSTKELAKLIEANCTVKHSDVVAVLTELAAQMRLQLMDSKRVVIDNLGAFKVGLRTKGAKTEKEFTNDNIVGVHILFQPEATRSKNGRLVRNLIDDVKVSLLPSNAPLQASGDGSVTDGGNGGGDTPGDDTPGTDTPGTDQP